MSSSQSAELMYRYQQAGASSGWSGTETSRDRAKEADSSGVTSRTQRQVLDEVASAQQRGRTIAEIRDLLPQQHHGALSSALTNLHRAGKVARLTEKRGRCKVYVLPGYVGNRPTESSRSSVSAAAVALQRVIKAHYPVLRADGYHYCAEDNQRFPCRTRILAGSLVGRSGK